MKTKLFFALLALIFGATTSIAQNQTKWRGPNANGIYNETGLMQTWPETGPEIIWHFAELGEGFSSPVFYNDQIFITGMEDETGFMYCLDNNGKLLWKKAYGPEWFENFPGSRTSPVLENGMIYMYSGKGVVYCLDAKNGIMKWKKDVMNDLDGRNIRWGVTETLAIDGDKVFCTAGGEEHFAFNSVFAQLFFGGASFLSPQIYSYLVANLQQEQINPNLLIFSADTL